MELITSVIIALIAAVPPTLMAFVVWKTGRKKLDEIHILVNSQATWDKKQRLKDLAAYRVVVRRLLGAGLTQADEALLAEMDERIEELQAEVDQRNKTAERIS